eukprot:scaffold2118_cov145-Skeletonema_menzelii.AAC.1
MAKSPGKNSKKKAVDGKKDKSAKTKSGGVGKKKSSKAHGGDSGKKTAAKKSSGKDDDTPAAVATMCLPAATDQQQRGTAENGAGGFRGNQNSISGGRSALANYAGTAADSFAQSFVDRWAGKMGGASSVDMPSTSQYSPMTGRNNMLSSWQQQMQMQQGEGNESDYRMMAMMMEQQQQVGWRVCAYCQNGAVMSIRELQVHEANCPFRGRSAGYAMMSSYGHDMNMMHPMQQQQMEPSFLGCLPIGTNIPSAAPGALTSGMNSNGLQLGGGQGGDGMIAPNIPHFSTPSEYASSKPVSSKQQNTTIRDSPLPKEDDPQIIENSKGPFKTLDEPMLLALDDDDYWLTPLHCFVRKNCVEVFTASSTDAENTPTKGKRRNVVAGQIGIRCPHCNKMGGNDIAGGTTPDKGENDVVEKKVFPSRGSVYYPNSITNVYNATMNLLQRHLFFCPNMPNEILKKYTTLKKDDARSGTSKMYWVESAKSLGFVDTLNGIKLSAKTPPSPPQVKVARSQNGEAAAARKRTRDILLSVDDGKKGDVKDDDTQLSGGNIDDDASPLVGPEDDKFTKFSFLLMSQMRRCVFTEADRLGKRKNLTNGFAGLACRHCYGGFGAGRFFPSSLKTLSDTSKTLNVIFSHLERCREVPKSVLDDLTKTKRTHEIERGNMKFGSQKAFFSRVWNRLHNERADGLKIDPPPRSVAKKKQKISVSDEPEPSVDELKLLRDNIALVTGKMSEGNMVHSMMMGGFANPAILNAMGGGNQPMLSMQRFASKRTSGEGDSNQPNHAEV